MWLCVSAVWPQRAQAAEGTIPHLWSTALQGNALAMGWSTCFSDAVDLVWILVQRAAEQCVARILQPKRGLAGAEAAPPTLPLTASWLLWPDQGRSTLGKVLGEMEISTAKKQVLQSIAGSFPCNAVLHKWNIVPSAACALCGHPAETQSHIQCLCPALKQARIRAHHNL